MRLQPYAVISGNALIHFCTMLAVEVSATSDRMSIPSFDQFIDPLLRLLVGRPDGIAARDATDAVADAVGISPEERMLLTGSGTDTVYGNRIRWAHNRLKRAGLSVSVRRGVWKATDAGLALAAEHPEALPAAEVERIADAEPDDTALKDEEIDASIAGERLAMIYRDADDRDRCLAFLAMAIEKAHAYGAGVWEVTLQRRRIRLNIGVMLMTARTQTFAKFSVRTAGSRSNGTGKNANANIH